MFTKALVPLDGSKSAEAALILAKSLVEISGELLLLRVVRPGQKREATQYLQDIKDNLLKENRRAKTLVVEAKAVVEAILAAAENEQVDIIVMCTTGLIGVGQMHLGTVTAQVLKLANKPVFVTRLQSF